MKAWHITISTEGDVTLDGKRSSVAELNKVLPEYAQRALATLMMVEGRCKLPNQGESSFYTYMFNGAEWVGHTRWYTIYKKYPQVKNRGPQPREKYPPIRRRE